MNERKEKKSRDRKKKDKGGREKERRLRGLKTRRFMKSMSNCDPEPCPQVGLDPL